MKKLLTLVLAVALCISTFAFVGCTPNNNSDDENNQAFAADFKVGLICLHDNNSTYDKNFIDAMYVACEELGLKTEGKDKQLIIVTGIPETAACYDAAIDLVEQGCDVIFANSFGHEKFLLQAAEENPEVEFCHATGTTAHTANQANFHNAFAHIYQGRYLAGVAAGLKLKELIDNDMLTANNYDAEGNVKVGYVGAFTYAEVISGYTSWFLGVRSIVPNVVMKVQFTGSWYDEVGERTAANTLIQEEGCALISQHADSMGAPNACEVAKIPNVSYNGSTAAQCPETYIISSRINWAPYYKYMITNTYEDKAFDIDKCGTLADESVQILEIGAAAAAGTAEKLQEVRTAIENGTLNVFDVSTFTVTVNTEKGINVNAQVDENGHLVSYMADVDTDAAFAADTQVVANGVFQESKFRSAPYFDVQIDGIELLNAEY